MRDLTYSSQISEDGTDEDIQYWIYEFQMPDEEKKRLLDMAASLGITTDEFVQASFRYAMDHPEESEREAKLQQIQKANALGIRLVKMYPVYQGKTEAQAYRRAVKEEMQRNEKYTVYRKTDISGQSRDVS